MTANEVMAKLTLEEKASLLCGKNFWQLKGIERLGLPPVFVADGPHGLRKQTDTPDHLGIHGSLPATCFPTACAVACSFDRRLASEIGKAMAEEALEQKVSVILGPGVNIKRNPLCGRNFEYFSEDPYTAGEMGAAIIDGIQSKETGTSLKHFAANNQEKARFYNNSVIDERAFREIYLAPFEKAVKKARPWTVMCSYNRINGVQASKNKLLLTGILRDEWGFRGLVMSDWGATSNRVDGVDAGLDLEMPFSGFWNEKQIVRAVRKGTLPAETVDKATLRAVELILKARSALDAHVDFRCDMTAHHALARRASAESAVLLKNESAEPGGTSPSAKSGVLPISPGQSIAVIGAFAKNPRYQGAGSSRVNPASLDNAFDALRGLGADAEYAAGYALGPESTDIGGALIAEAVLLAGKKDAAVIFAGLPDEYESEGYDRTDMDLPKSHNELIEAVAAANPNTVVVLQLGSPVIMPWASKVRAILVAYLGGQAGGGGIADVLLGRVNPGGKLAETWPLSLAGVPSYRYFGGDKVTEYRESIFAGYRYYDTAGAEPAYPFGHGLSYTGFTYSDLRLNQSRFKPGETVTAGLTVHNSGNYDGAEIVQLYIEREGDSKIFRAKKELKGFEKVFLKSGESTDVNFTLDDRSFAYYNSAAAAWAIEGGVYRVYAASSSRDIRLEAELTVEGDGREESLAALRQSAEEYFAPKKEDFSISDSAFSAVLGRPAGEPSAAGAETGRRRWTIDNTFGDIKDTPIGKLLWKIIHAELNRRHGAGPSRQKTQDLQAMAEIPFRSVHMAIPVSSDKVELLVKMLNWRWNR